MVDGLSATVAAAGRVFRAHGNLAHRANQNEALNTLMGINGYNGTILWKRPLREGFLIHRNGMVATSQPLATHARPHGAAK